MDRKETHPDNKHVSLTHFLCLSITPSGRRRITCLLLSYKAWLPRLAGNACMAGIRGYSGLMIRWDSLLYWTPIRIDCLLRQSGIGIGRVRVGPHLPQNVQRRVVGVFYVVNLLLWHLGILATGILADGGKHCPL